MSGMSGQLGIKTESVYGTGVTVDLFDPGYLSGNPTRDQPPLISKGIRAGRRTPKCISTGPKTVEGSISKELYTAPLATYLRHMFGTIATTGSGPYTHTASPGTLNGKSFTAQFGIAGTGGTVHPFTFTGTKIEKWSLKAESGEIAMLDLDFVAKDYVTATALATASYPTDCPFTFVHGSVSIAGSTISTVKSFELTSERPLRKFHPVGSATIIEPLEEGRTDQPYGITVETEFESLTVHDLANTAVAVVLAFSDGTNSLTVTTNAWVVPTTPEVQGVDSLNSFTFTAIPYGTTDAGAVTAVLVNGEATSA
jgi:hypothetical protein